MEEVKSNKKKRNGQLKKDFYMIQRQLNLKLKDCYYEDDGINSNSSSLSNRKLNDNHATKLLKNEKEGFTRSIDYYHRVFSLLIAENVASKKLKTLPFFTTSLFSTIGTVTR